MDDTVTISRLGHDGDGLVDSPSGPRVVPGTLPGETVRIAEDGSVLERLTSSPERSPPPCRHFGTCGGCVAQHMAPDLYARWKSGLLEVPLRQHGITASTKPLRTTAPRSRRRAVLAAIHAREGPRLGYHARRSHEVVAIEECPLITPALERQLPGFRKLAALVEPRESELRLTVVDCGTGIDVTITGAERVDSAAVRKQLADLAAGHGILRITVGPDEIVRHATPSISAGGVAISPPPGGFIQAVGGIEQAMAESAVAAIGRSKRVVDLFCGIGAFTFPLARRAAVTAVDSSKPALAALDAARRQTQGLKPITTLARDLMREPMSAKELEPFEAIVFDPPRAGAKMQVERIARSKARTVIAVSCNPPTLSRDLATLIAGGYNLIEVTPFDQFLWSPHVEAVALLEKPKKRR